MPPVQDSAVASIFPLALKALRTFSASSDKGQPHGRGALGGDAFTPAGEAELFRRRRLDADLVKAQARDLRHAGAHLFTMRTDLGALGDDVDVEMGYHAAAV